MQILIDHNWPGNIRELRNLVESMVVLAPGRQIRPEDIPDEVRGGGVALLPVTIPRPGTGEGGVGEGALVGIRPELEFVFRTLVELRVDMDELRREFDAYRDGMTPPDSADTLLGSVASGEITIPAGLEIPAYVPGEEAVAEPEVVENVVIYRHGMTIDDMERAAIEVALRDVDGNRRKAAELLGIGERTLYRKISRYGLDT